jgi:hypothetical protein
MAISREEVQGLISAWDSLDQLGLADYVCAPEMPDGVTIPDKLQSLDEEITAAVATVEQFYAAHQEPFSQSYNQLTTLIDQIKTQRALLQSKLDQIAPDTIPISLEMQNRKANLMHIQKLFGHRDYIADNFNIDEVVRKKELLDVVRDHYKFLGDWRTNPDVDRHSGELFHLRVLNLIGQIERDLSNPDIISKIADNIPILTAQVKFAHDTAAPKEDEHRRCFAAFQQTAIDYLLAPIRAAEPAFFTRLHNVLRIKYEPLAHRSTVFADPPTCSDPKDSAFILAQFLRNVVDVERSYCVAVRDIFANVWDECDHAPAIYFHETFTARALPAFEKVIKDNHDIIQLTILFMILRSAKPDDDFAGLFDSFKAVVEARSRVIIDEFLAKHEQIVVGCLAKDNSFGNLAEMMDLLNQLSADLDQLHRIENIGIMSVQTVLANYFSNLAVRLPHIWEGQADSRFFTVAGFILMKGAKSGSIITFMSCVEQQFKMKFQGELKRVNPRLKMLELNTAPPSQLTGFSDAIQRFRDVCLDDQALVFTMRGIVVKYREWCAQRKLRDPELTAFVEAKMIWTVESLAQVCANRVSTLATTEARKKGPPNRPEDEIEREAHEKVAAAGEVPTPAWATSVTAWITAEVRKLPP